MNAANNTLRGSLPASWRKRVLALGEPVELKLGDVLCKVGDRVEYVYFPIDGFISLVNELTGGPGLEVGMVGREGMLGAQVVLHIMTFPLLAVVQGTGTALRIGLSEFMTELERNLPLRMNLNRYLYVVMAQLAATSSCTRFHEIGPRLAQWLLMSHDRASSGSFHLTQEFLGFMLGVRRVGTTRAASEFQKDSLICYHRGDITVLNRLGLETAACGCYASDILTYKSQFPEEHLSVPAFYS